MDKKDGYGNIVHPNKNRDLGKRSMSRGLGAAVFAIAFFFVHVGWGRSERALGTALGATARDR